LSRTISFSCQCLSFATKPMHYQLRWEEFLSAERDGRISNWAGPGVRRLALKTKDVSWLASGTRQKSSKIQSKFPH
jgi:hypothetical protein